jgi:hypothetical protein
MRLALLLPLALLGCPASQPTPVDAGPTPDAGNVAQPPTITFTQINPKPVAVPSGFVRGVAGELFAVADGHVLRSTDSGLTFETRAAFPAALASDEDGTLYGVQAGHLLRSTDAAATFTDIPTPDVQSKYPPQIAALRGGIVWLISSGSDPAHLYRSTDRGTTFAEVALPAPSNDILPFKSLDSHLLLHDRQAQHLLRTLDGATWEALNLPGNPEGCLETRGGSVLINAYVNQQYAGYRQFDGGWTPLPFNGFCFFDQRPNGGLIHRESTEAVDESFDEGATWHRISPGESTQAFNTSTALDDVILAEADGPPARLEPDGGWVIPPLQGLQHPAVANYGDIAFADDGRIALAGSHLIFVSQDQGASWHSAFRSEDTSPIRAVAYRPDGKRLFVGGNFARYSILDEDALTVILSADLEVTAEKIQQAAWLPARFEYGQLYVTTAKDDASDGALVTLQPEYGIGVQLLNPFRIASSPSTIFPTGYDGLTVTSNGPNGNYILVGYRRSSDNGIRTEKLGGDGWSEYTNPTNNRPTLSLSASGPYGDPVAALFTDNGLFLGTSEYTQLPVTVVGVLGDYRRAKFAPDGHLWLITTGGIYRSNEAFGSR